jgi:[ribosomal protein S5]-alanine N-acetyltransferase
MDIDEVLQIRSDEEIMRYIGKPLLTTKAEAFAYMQELQYTYMQKEGICWAIALKDDPRMIGMAGYRRFIREHYRGEIGYAILPAFQRKGYMQETLTAIVEYGFNKIGLHSIEANVDKENIASIHLLEKNGFTKEAHFKENYFFNGRFIDSVIYSLLSPLQPNYAEP